jgi:glycosyltransferase involved in cell wall biosynthesis
MKVIHVMSQGLRGELKKESFHKSDFFFFRYAREMGKCTDKYPLECWWTDNRTQEPLSAKEDGLIYRAFPAYSFRFPYRYVSIPLYKALERECKRGPTLLYLHGIRGKWTTLLPLFIRNTPMVALQYMEGILYGKKKLMKRPWFLPFYLLERKALKRMAHFFLLYEEARQELSRWIEPSRISLLPNGVDFQRFRPMDRLEARRALQLDPSARYILFVGRINERKGISYLLEAMPEVLRNYPNARVLAVGPARRETLLNELLGRMEGSGIRDKVTFLGQTPNDRLPLYYNAADLFVLPTLTEGMGITFIEAAACNCPIIGTAVGGVVDIMKNLPRGIPIPPRSPEAISRAIKKVFENPEYYGELRDSAMSYSWPRLMEKAVRTLEELEAKYFGRKTHL